MPRRRLAPVRVNPVLAHPRERRLALSGGWRFRLDPQDQGLEERWCEGLGDEAAPIQVPGCWQGQGFGGDGTDTVWDFRLQARVFRATYTGTGWYEHSFAVSAGWQGARLFLRFGGAHPHAEVWLNGAPLGENGEPFVPFGFEITDLVRPGEPNRLVVRVDERSRELGLAFSWQGNWSGLYRGVDLVATGASCIESLRLYPDVSRGVLGVKALLRDPGAVAGPLALSLSAEWLGPEPRPVRAEVAVAEEWVEAELPIPDLRTWSPDSPQLYRVDAALVAGEEVLDALAERVGFVTLATEGKHVLINGDPYYLRGTGEFLSNPETGCPDTDRERWRRKLATLRDYGYNYVRCQSFVPAPEYLDVADEVGLLIQSEMGALGAWGGQTPWHGYAWPQPTPGNREALKRQWDAVVLRDVNHPSANLYCMSNELGGGTQFPRTAWQCYRDTKAQKPTALVLWTDGGWNPDLPGDFVNDTAARDADCPRPVVQHEFQWWSSLPDPALRPRYSGAVRPYAAEIALEAAARHGIAHLLPMAARNSQRLQLVEAKLKMEECRRDHPTLAGICHFNAMDANPSPQGIVDEFYERKVADAATWRETNGDTVVLSTLGFDDRILAPGDTLRCRLSVSDFSHPPLRDPVLEWQLLAGGKRLAAGRVEYAHQPYCTCPAGEVAATVPEVTSPVAAQLVATLTEGDRVFRNQWDVWLFPGEAALPPSVARYGPVEYTWLKTVPGLQEVSADGLGEVRAVLTERLDAALVAFARGGGRVILVASEGLVRPFPPKFGFSVGHYFITPPANYPPYEDGHDGTILTAHPMLGALPHEGFADLQLFRVIANSPPLDLEPLGLADAEVILRVMHSYPVSRPLGYLVEGAYGSGRIILSALGLDWSWPEARYLLAQLTSYAVSPDPPPAAPLSDAAVEALVTATAMP